VVDGYGGKERLPCSDSVQTSEHSHCFGGFDFGTKANEFELIVLREGPFLT